MKFSPVVTAMVAQSSARLSIMPKHDNPELRAVSVVAWNIDQRKASVFERYHSEPLGANVTIDGFDFALIACEAAP